MVEADVVGLVGWRCRFFLCQVSKAQVYSQTQTVLNTLDKAQTRSNVMHRALRQVEALPEGQVPGLLPNEAEESDGEAQ